MKTTTTVTSYQYKDKCECGSHLHFKGAMEEKMCLVCGEEFRMEQVQEQRMSSCDGCACFFEVGGSTAVDVENYCSTECEERFADDEAV